MIDEQSSASGHDYASDRSAIGAGSYFLHVKEPVTNGHLSFTDNFSGILKCPLKTCFTVVNSHVYSPRYSTLHIVTCNFKNCVSSIRILRNRSRTSICSTITPAGSSFNLAPVKNKISIDISSFNAVQPITKITLNLYIIAKLSKCL